MAIATPWDLGTAQPVPSSVKCWALASTPAPPFSLGNVQAVALDAVTVSVSWGAPAIDPPGQVVSRTIGLQFQGPANQSLYPITVAAVAFVETSGGNQLLGVFALQVAVVLQAVPDVQEVPGWLQAAQLGSGNG